METKPVVVASLLTLAILLILACGLVPEPTKEPVIESMDKEQVYYLGAFRGCIFTTLIIIGPTNPSSMKKLCTLAVQQMYDTKIHNSEQDPPMDWEWPPATLTPTPTSTPTPTVTPTPDPSGTSLG